MVNSRNRRAKLHQRRAISTIIGGAIFLVLLTGGFSTFFLAMDFQRDTINTQRAISDSIMEKTKEKFAISVSTNDINNNRLAIQVKNQGTNPVEIDNIWIINNSGTHPAEKYLIDYKDSVIPPGYGVDILDNSPLFMYSDDYDIKVVSTLGTIEKADLIVGSANNLRATLIAIPPDVKVGQNVTLTLHVENIGNTRLLNVAPVNDSGKLHPNISPEFTTPHPTPPQSVNLDPGEGVFFTWEYETSGAANSIVEFNANVTALEEITGFSLKSNTGYSDIELREPDESELIVLEKDLFSRPEIFLVIPSPMGTSDGDKGLWGANIVNPTPAILKVSRLTFTILSPRENNADLMFNPTSNPSGKCDPEAVGSVTVDSEWACSTQNQLTWSKLGIGVDIPPFSAKQFTAKVHADRLNSNNVEIPAVIVIADVFTNLGEFSKAGYSSSFDDGGTVIANTYLSTVPWSIDNDEIITTDLAIPSNSLVTMYATLADFEEGGSIIEAGSKFIVNIPKTWTIENPLTDIDGLDDFSIVHIPWPDGSSQIVGTLLAPGYDGTPGTNGPPRQPDEKALSIQFTVRAPTVTNERMYVMYILAEGLVDVNDFSIGPLNEVVLQVVP